MHPHVAEEYPCSVCVAENNQRQQPQPQFLGVFAGEEIYGDETTKKAIEHLQAELDQLRHEVAQYREIRAGSQGVAGWHQNGDVADWEEFEL